MARYARRPRRRSTPKRRRRAWGAHEPDDAGCRGVGGNDLAAQHRHAQPADHRDRPPLEYRAM